MSLTFFSFLLSFLAWPLPSYYLQLWRVIVALDHTPLRPCATHTHTHSLTHTHTHTYTRLDEWSARRRDPYLKAQNTQKSQISMPPAGFESAIPASELPQAHALYRAATGIGRLLTVTKNVQLCCQRFIMLLVSAVLLAAWRILTWVFIMCHSIVNTNTCTLSLVKSY